MRTGFLVVLIAACHSSGPSPAPPPPAAELGTQHAAPAAPAPVAATPAVAPAPPAAEPAPPPPAGADFIADAKLLYRVAACGGADEGRTADLAGDPAVLTKVVAQHCKNILERVGKFRTAYFEKNRGWFEDVVPKDAPKTVIYPFGGGDLISALVAFPDATEITTISLELAGDPRRMRTLKPVTLDGSLGAFRSEIGGLISVGSNTSENLSKGQRNELPGQVSSFLIGLVAGGFEPVAMRYFTLDDVGEIHYLEQAEIEAVDRKRTKSLKGDWLSPNFSEAFANVEIQYKKPGEKDVRIHRHIAWNLGDAYMGTHPQLVRHLAKKGKVTILTKGASYLLQRPDFSVIRGYMLDNLAWMLSDSTGIPPTYAKAAGMIQETYGYYNGAFLAGAQNNRHDDSFVALWRSQPRRRLPFRFGYVDKDSQAHLVVTRPRA
jgi:hypothetical protein